MVIFYGGGGEEKDMEWEGIKVDGLVLDSFGFCIEVGLWVLVLLLLLYVCYLLYIYFFVLLNIILKR